MRILLSMLLAAAAYGQVEGRVMDGATGRPIPGVTLVLQGDADSYILETGAAGAFRVTEMQAGAYEVRVQHEGFLPPRRAVRFRVEPSVPVNLTIRLIPLGAIAGRVMDSDGDPVAGATVEAWSGGKGRATTRTDDRGAYRLFALAPGKYRVTAAMPYPTVGASSRFMKVLGPKVNTDYTIAWFPDAPDETGASELEVKPGGELRDIDLQLRPQSLYQIRVQVNGGSSSSASELSLGIGSRSGRGGAFEFGGMSYRKQRTLPPQPPGTYLVYARDRTQDLSARQMVTIRDADVDVMLNLVPRIDVSGTVQVRDAAQARADGVRLQLEGEEGWGKVASAVVANGRFGFTEVDAGAYALRVSVPAGTYLHSIRQGDRMLEKQRLELTERNQPLVITLATDGGIIEGTAEEGVEVTLAPADGWPDHQRTATAGKDGRFEIHDVPPGAYRLSADGEPVGEVRVTAGSRQNLAIKLR